VNDFERGRVGWRGGVSNVGSSFSTLEIGPNLWYDRRRGYGHLLCRSATKRRRVRPYVVSRFKATKRGKTRLERTRAACDEIHCAIDFHTRVVFRFVDSTNRHKPRSVAKVCRTSELAGTTPATRNARQERNSLDLNRGSKVTKKQRGQFHFHASQANRLLVILP